MSEIKKYQNWPGLVEYTKEFKEWIWKLFRKVHARIGHVEEELASVREKTAVNYQLVENPELVDGKYEYTLYDFNHPEEYHGKIVIDVSTGIQTVNWYDWRNGTEQRSAGFTRSYRWEGSRAQWETIISPESLNIWKNRLVFANINEPDGSITKYIWAGDNAFTYEMGAVYWDSPEDDGERP